MWTKKQTNSYCIVALPLKNKRKNNLSSRFKDWWRAWLLCAGATPFSLPWGTPGRTKAADASVTADFPSLSLTGWQTLEGKLGIQKKQLYLSLNTKTQQKASFTSHVIFPQEMCLQGRVSLCLHVLKVKCGNPGCAEQLQRMNSDESTTEVTRATQRSRFSVRR